jgi:hypothetical protein
MLLNATLPYSNTPIRSLHVIADVFWINLFANSCTLYTD